MTTASLIAYEAVRPALASRGSVQRPSSSHNPANDGHGVHCYQPQLTENKDDHNSHHRNGDQHPFDEIATHHLSPPRASGRVLLPRDSSPSPATRFHDDCGLGWPKYVDARCPPTASRETNTALAAPWPGPKPLAEGPELLSGRPGSSLAPLRLINPLWKLYMRCTRELTGLVCTAWPSCHGLLRADWRSFWEDEGCSGVGGSMAFGSTCRLNRLRKFAQQSNRSSPSEG